MKPINIEKQIAQDVDFSDDHAKAAFIGKLQHLTGIFSIKMSRRKRRRTNQQNKMLWGVIYPAVAAGFLEAWGENFSPDEIHIICKEMFLSRPVVNRDTGEVIARTYPSSAILSVEQFSEYLEKIFRFAGESLGCVVPSAVSSY